VAEAVRRRQLAAVPVAALVIAAACRTAAPPPAPAPVPQPAPPPTRTPVAAPAPPVEPVALPQREDMQPPLIRVLLQEDDQPALPEPGRRYAATCGAGVKVVRGPISVALTAGPAALQVGAFADATNANATVVRLKALGFATEAQPGSDRLVRVVVTGAAGESADALRARLLSQGFPDARPAPGAAGRQVVLRGEVGSDLVCDEIRLVPFDPEPVRVGIKSVRGELRVRAGGAGPAMINVVNLEAYLRGVVPAEMGPRAFPAIEALKAQAVAARTYAVAHLGEYDTAGYDICDSQLCQVYGGVDMEQPLTDRAVADTAGEIAVYAGEPIDAMYHSTCGGHTEDAAAVFPERAAPYLKGVACRTEGAILLGGNGPKGGWIASTERLARVGEALAAALGVPARAATLATKLGGRPAGQGAAGLQAAYSLPPLATLAHGASPDGSEEQLLGVLATFRLPLADRTPGVARPQWEMALAVRLGQLSGAVRTISGYLVPGPAGARLVDERGSSLRDLAATTTACEKRADAWRCGTFPAPVGSPAVLWCAGDVCPLIEVEPKPEADGASAWSWWARELTRDDVARRLAFPSLEDVAVTRRGVSGRALTVSLRGAGGNREIGGYAFRRALELPDTLFVVQRRSTPAGAVLRFLGRGWGHGVGMCQNGAYGLALAGASYRQVLAAYYTGIDVVRWNGTGGQR
jgi:stage II sporulation protein D